MDLLTANDRAGQYPESYYAATATPGAAKAALQGDLRADVCIVGAGYTGMSAALHLAGAGMDVVVLEANRAGWGASGRNGGQVGSGQRQDQDWLEAKFGQDTAKALWKLSEEAKGLVRELVARHGIDCDLKPGIIEASHKAAWVGAYHEHADKLRRIYGYEQIEPLDRSGICAALGTEAYYGGAIDHGAAHLHPLKYALGLAEAASGAGARLFENSRVTRVVPGARPRVETVAGAVEAAHVLLACNGYLGDLSGPVAARVMPINNFIVATEPLGADLARELIRDDVAVADSRFVVSYYRLSADHRLLFGGGETYGYRFPKDIAALVRPRMLQVYPQLAKRRTDYAWGGTLAITTDRMPAFQRPGLNIYSAAGYSGHGVAMATLAGRLMAEAVQGTAERFDVFAHLPQRGFPGGAALRTPLLALAMSWYALRDRL